MLAEPWRKCTRSRGGRSQWKGANLLLIEACGCYVTVMHAAPKVVWLHLCADIADIGHCRKCEKSN